jgi:hypothetical protein
MYQIRLQEWGVRKNMTREDKKRILTELGASDDLAPNEKRKIRRYKADKRRQAEGEETALTDLADPFEEASESVTGSLSSDATAVHRSYATSVVDLGKSAGISNLSLSSAYAATLTPRVSVSPESSSWELVGTPLDCPSWTGPRINHNTTDDPWAPVALMDEWRISAFMPLERPLPNDPDVSSLPRVLSFTQDLVRSHARTMFLEQDERQRAAFTPPRTMEHFWSDLNNCIYLFKLRDWRRAEPLYKALVGVSSEVFSNVTPDFLRRFFTAFSPVNFQVNPVVRKELLKHFLSRVRELWGSEHSFTRLIYELQLDINSRELSEVALSCLQQSVRGEAPHVERQHPHTDFSIEVSIITLQRRSKDFAAAAHSASTLLTQSKERLGPESPEARDATEQLAHVYMDTQRLEEARALCLERLGLINRDHRDKRAMRAMEDLAEIERKLGQPRGCITWLQGAAILAAEIQRPDVVILHIVDKVMESSTMCGKDEEARLWRRDFNRDVWKKPDVDCRQGAGMSAW